MSYEIESVRGPLQKIVAEVVRTVPPEQAPLVAWQFACGTRVAEKTEAIAYADGVLTVQVPDNTWRLQLGDMVNQYIPLVRRYSGQKVERIEFVAPPTVVVQK